MEYGEFSYIQCKIMILDLSTKILDSSIKLLEISKKIFARMVSKILGKRMFSFLGMKKNSS